MFAASAAAAILLTWPLAWHLGSRIPSDVGDPVLNTWILWWNASHLPLGDAWWNAPAFFPAQGVLAFSEHLLGLSLLTSPVIWLTGSPLVAYNVAFLATFPLSATATFLLVRELTGRADAAAVAGLVFGFAPYRVAHFSHLQILASFWMPLALFALHRFLGAGGLRWLLLFAWSWLMQALTNGYYLVYFTVFVAAWTLWFVAWRDWRRVAAIAGAGTAATLALAPLILGYRRVHEFFGLTRAVETISSLGADLASWLDASPLLWLWGGLHVFHRAEGELFPGLTAAVLAIAAVVVAMRDRKGAALDRSTLAFYLVAAVGSFLFALGPTPTWLGAPVTEAAPYDALMWLPGVESLRVPARFAMLMVLSLSVAAGFGTAALARAVPARRRPALIALLAGAVLIEGWPRTMPLWDPPSAWDIEATDIDRALIVLPVLNELNDVAHMYRAMSHARPVVNGYSGHLPPWYRTLKEGLNALDSGVLDVLARAGVTQVAIVSRNDRDGIWHDFVITRGTLRREAADGSYRLYDLPAPTPVRTRTYDRRVPVSSIEVEANRPMAAGLTDGDLTTRWHTAGPQAGGETVVIDLGAAQPFSAVELALGRHTFDHPRELVVEVSADGLSWEEAWRGRGAVPALAGGFRAPRAMPLLLELGDRVARFIRLDQVGRHETAYWSIAELSVLAASR